MRIVAAAVVALLCISTPALARHNEVKIMPGHTRREAVTGPRPTLPATVRLLAARLCVPALHVELHLTCVDLVVLCVLRAQVPDNWDWGNMTGR